MNLSKLLIATGFIASAIASALPLNAQTAVTIIKDAEGSVYIRGLAAGAPAEFIFTGIETTKNTVSNTCGAVILRGSAVAPIPANIRVGTTAIDVTALASGLLPGCTAGVWQIPPTSNFKTPDGRVVIIGQTPNTAIPVTFTGDRLRSATANLCGQVRLKSSTSFTIGGTFTLGGTSYAVDTLPVKNAPICRAGITYLAVE